MIQNISMLHGNLGERIQNLPLEKELKISLQHIVRDLSRILKNNELSKSVYINRINGLLEKARLVFLNSGQSFNKDSWRDFELAIITLKKVVEGSNRLYI